MAFCDQLAMAALYDRIGLNYADLRKPDPRIASVLHAALGDAATVLNVGAGAGSYEPADRQVTAVEPSLAMIRKRAASDAVVVQGVAESLPFADDGFDASMAVLTIHHWTDQAAGLREMRRVTRGPIVLLTFDPAHRPWLTNYFPALATLDQAQMPPMARYAEWLGDLDISSVPVPHDCTDGFLYAYWRRPEAYLDPRIRQGSSSFWALGDVSEGVGQLRADLVSGRWARRYADLLKQTEYDAGYRLVVTR
jgi:SAM-dependent methyltransferase